MSKKYTTNFLEDTNGSTGSANQVLVSTAAGIDWVDGSGSSIIGGPYLPLSAGSGFPLTGDLYLATSSNLGKLQFGTANSDYYIRGGGYYGYININGPIVRFDTNGSEKMRITSSGNVGIGTTSPGSPLSVVGSYSSSDEIIEIGGGTGINTDFKLKIGAVDQDYIWFQSVKPGDNYYDLVFNPTAGNVGIGTTSPGSKLEVKHTSNTGDGAKRLLGLYNSGGALGEDAVLEIGHGSTRSAIITAHKMGTGNNHDLSFSTNAVSAAATEKMRITSTGNVGIGTTSPGQKLDVRDGTITSRDSGNVNYAELDRFAGLTLKGNGAGAKYVSTPNTDALGFKTNNSERMRITSSGNVGIGVTSSISGTLTLPNSGIISFHDANGDARNSLQFVSGELKHGAAGAGLTTQTFFTNGTERMRIASTGSVGIGTTTPDSKLDVTGGDITVNTAGTGFMNFKYGAVGSETSRGSITTDGIDLKVNATADLLLLPSGNVGIGTTSPATILDLDDGTLSDIRIRGNATTDVRFAGIAFYNTAGSDTVAAVNVDRDGANDAGALTFDTQPAGGGNTERMRITSAGNIGIGTNNPSAKLDVSGNVKAETLIATDLNDGYVPYSKSGTLGLQDSKIYTQGAGIGVGTTTLAAGCHITSLSNISATGYRVSAMQTAPSSRGDTGTLGEIRITADYIYVCYATNSWKRVAIAQW
jgi:hypothetical protein